MPSASEQRSGVDCHGQCEHCHLMPSDVKGGLSGGRLVLASAGVFIFPLVLAIAGGILCRANPDHQALGVVAGLAAGGLIASLAVKRLYWRFGETK
ncbi:MAG TPA: hypothetical protein PKM67_09375 [Kiritimatiellia bacterium]|nr:hypothetical protein [Kiritimatiellia bacterium]HNS81652.1 hypothetical protein [Kiritimatiellia bacterium]HPA78432.1 hypothetical protein [Kiritimatiellia bacterium]HQQ04621.1 hypothetical protein [Kiritimatiellia bacterium]